MHINQRNRGKTMEHTFENLDDLEFVPALQIADKVAFEHNGATFTGQVDWILADGFVSVMVDGQSRPFIGEQKTFKIIDK